MNPIYLSICIPTNGRIEILKKTLDSIFVNCTVSYSDFEVVLSDNSVTDELLELLDSYQQYPNIIYSKTTAVGFLNSVNALKIANGLFLKLHNNYTMINKDSLDQMVSFVKNMEKIKPVIFFTNGLLGSYDVKQYDSFDLFSYGLSYWNSWSSGFSVWKQDFDNCSLMHLSGVFPQTSLLLLQHEKSTFIIDDKILFTNQEVPKKGGYNLFKTFGIDYLKIMEDATTLGMVSAKTFTKIKKDLFYKFFIEWYHNTKIVKNDFTFDMSGIADSLAVYYGKHAFYKLKILSHMFYFKRKAVSLFKPVN